MANVQKQFEKFHEDIRMDFDMDERLRNKRDIILERIAARIKNAQRPGFRQLLQGSYQMKTGVKPLRGEPYDLDVGMRFSFSDATHEAADVRAWVQDAIDGHTKSVKSKGPCIRVTYADGFHIDLVMYATWEDQDGEAHYRLAHRDDGWVPADPQGLLSHVAEAATGFAGSEGSTKIDQLRRVIRYLKRWDDVWMPDGTAGKLSGLALTLLAIDHLRGPVLSWDGKPDDCTALRQIAGYAASVIERITARKPTPQYEDMFGGLTETQMDELKARFRNLYDATQAAASSADPIRACEHLRAVLGDSFSVPHAAETAVRTGAPAIVTSSSSA